MPARPPPLVLLLGGLALVIAAFALDTFAGGSGHTSADSAPPVVQTLVGSTMPSGVQGATATSTSAAGPTATVLPDRSACSAITGTTYRSDSERTWYLANCTSF